MKSRAISIIKGTRPGSIDWRLLLFLLVFLDVKLVIKIAAVVLIYIVRPNFKFGFSLKSSRLPLFYVLAPGIAVLNWIIIGKWANFNYGLVLLTGILFWVLCILAIHQVKLSVEKYDPEIIHRTILVFFILNALVSLVTFAGIILETGSINPYRYQGNFQKYFIGTGDYIKGLTFDTSTTNAVINAFGVIYFLMRGRYIFMLLCMMTLLLTGSNITNFILCFTLLPVFFYRSSRDQKTMIVICLVMLLIFLVKVSPQNNSYVVTAYQKIFNRHTASRQILTAEIPVTQKPDSILTFEERRKKIAQLYMDSVNIALYNKNLHKIVADVRSQPVIALNEKPVIPADSIHTPSFQHRDDTSLVEKKLLQFVVQIDKEEFSTTKKRERPKLPGKLIAARQTLRYFRQYPLRSISGTGIGNFSSKLAFRSTAMKISGNYPAKYAYINPAFEFNHLDLYLLYFTGKEEMHSMANSPNNTYDQLLGEYGLAGLSAFLFFYLLFFAKQLKKYAYGIPLLLFMATMFFADYWFEQLSVVVFFELLLLLNIKELKTD